jgi:intraflagellar transport protein 74
MHNAISSKTVKLTHCDTAQGRQVMDETYFLSALRSKSAELTAEINRMNAAITKLERDHASYSTYEKKAEALASEIKGLQGA